MILKIDVDTPRGRLPRVELERRARIAQVVIVSVTDTRSPSGRGFHRLIEIQRMGQGDNPGACGNGSRRAGANMTRGARGRCARASMAGFVPTAVKGTARTLLFSALECVALHLLFGSDPIREAFNLHRARLVDSKQVSAFWRARWNTTYATRRGKE